MNTAEKKARYTPEEYLEIDDANEFKSEFHNGEIFAMSGGTPNHNKIGINLMGEIRNRLKGKPCSTFSSDMKIWIPQAESFVYPDGSVVCGEEMVLESRNDVLLNPILVIEVLSDATAAYDRGGKFHKYQQIPALREYVLVEQHELRVDVFALNERGKWELESYSELNQKVELRSLGIHIPMEEVYYRVEFEA